MSETSSKQESKMTKFSNLKKRGCPTCGGIDARSCMRCQGKTRMCDWYNTKTGWAHYTELTHEEWLKIYNASLQPAARSADRLECDVGQEGET